MSETAFVSEAVETMEGDRVIVKRLFPVAGLRNQDPFVLWDHFEISSGSGFPPHPHRGFEAITYLFSGTMEHEDNLGNKSTVGQGGAQRFTAGRGIVHSEMPGDKETASGIQLWINLPKRLKQIDADYQAASSDEIVSQTITGASGNNATRRSIVGENGPIKLHTPVVYFDLTLGKNGSYQWTPPEASSGLVYIVEGSLVINSDSLQSSYAYRLTKPVQLNFQSKEGARLMVAFGIPHGEPIIQRGTNVD
jgi:redox-sensitive bicupin YhaK (pirin superfamily)